MNLTVMRFDDRSKRHILRLKRGRFSGREFVVDMAVCPSPLCPCANIDFVCSPASAGATASEEYRFTLDTHRWRLADGQKQKLDPQSLSMADSLVAELQDADWHALYSFLFHLKQEQVRAADIETLEADFPADVLADPDIMVSYSEIVPYGEKFQFLLEGRNWLAECQFCVNPECDCRDCSITFIPLPGLPGPSRRIEAHLPTALYDYGTRKFEMDIPPDDNQPSTDALVSELKRAYPDLDGIVEKHHDILRRLYGKASRGARRRPAARTKEAGRNDPCLCGSGRKYKKCCGP